MVTIIIGSGFVTISYYDMVPLQEVQDDLRTFFPTAPVYMYIYIHIYMHIYIYTHIHIHM